MMNKEKKAAALASIVEMDKTLSMLKQGFDGAKPEKKKEWSDRIDGMLDERFKLMRVRDGFEN